MARKEKLFKTTMLVTLVIILSKVCGFVRDMIMANYFGTGVENDAYVSAYSLFYLPVLLFNSCISATLIPLYVQEREENGLAASNRFASNTLNLFALAALVVSAVMFVLAEPLVKLVYVGFDAQKAALTVQLTRIMLLSLVFNVSSIVLSSLLNASDRFIGAQLTGFPLSFCIILASVAFSARYGIQAIAWGVFFSGILQIIVMLPFTRGWFTYSPIIDMGNERFKKLLVLAGPALLSMGISELNHMIDHALASGLNSGDISAMSYAYRLITFLLGVLMVPLTTVMFSRMSHMVAEKDIDGLLKSLRHSVCIICMVVFPIVAIAVIMSTDVIKFAYMRGAFDMDSVKVTAGILVFYVIGVPAFGIRDYLNRLFHALQDTKTPFRVACLVVLMNIVLNFILRTFMGANGLALATFIASAVGMLVMFALLRKRFKGLGFKAILPDFIRIVLATLLCGATCMGINQLLPEAFGTFRVFVRLAITSIGALGVYAASCYLLRVQVFRQFTDQLIRRIHR